MSNEAKTNLKKPTLAAKADREHLNYKEDGIKLKPVEAVGPDGSPSQGVTPTVAPAPFATLAPTPVGSAPAPQMPVYKRLKFQQRDIGDNVVLVTPPTVTPEAIRQSEPELVAQYRDMLWKKLASLPASERNTPFWRQVQANPEGAAIALIQRMHTNLNVFAGQGAPKLDEAMRARLENNEIMQLLSFIEYADENF